MARTVDDILAGVVTSACPALLQAVEQADWKTAFDILTGTAALIKGGLDGDMKALLQASAAADEVDKVADARDRLGDRAN